MLRAWRPGQERRERRRGREECGDRRPSQLPSNGQPEEHQPENAKSYAEAHDGALWEDVPDAQAEKFESLPLGHRATGSSGDGDSVTAGADRRSGLVFTWHELRLVARDFG
jgi:hypothetical protein